MIALARAWTLAELARTLGGEARGDAPVRAVSPIDEAGEGVIAPLLASRYVRAAEAAIARGACVLADASLAERLPRSPRVWTHASATWALAGLLDACDVRDDLEREAARGEGTTIGAHAVIGPRVTLGKRVTIGAHCVIGAPGFGWAHGPNGAVRRVPQLGGVVIEDDVAIGPLSTVDAGTLAPTRVRRGAKLDTHVHVGHNVDIGEGAMIAAQCGFAGSVTIGKGVLVGGQAGFADHVHVGDGARVAAKSGVIGDVPAGAVVAGYPAIARGKWLRGLARLYRGPRA